MTRKNKTTNNFVNYKMTNEVYKLRKKVINILYELKDKGFNLPRIVTTAKHLNRIEELTGSNREYRMRYKDFRNFCINNNVNKHYN